ncbi:MAG: chlorophyllase [Prochloraceae cyanobacterium]|nr:chlorophyllase [Prochloraceae cyanobacterium]
MKNRSLLVFLITGFAISLSSLKPCQAKGFSPKPSYQQTAQYTTKIANIRGNFDPADIYYPVVSDNNKNRLPVALFLQGALVDRGDYSNFANIVASYGFVVIVPDRRRSVYNSKSDRIVTGLLAETSQIEDTLNFINSESLNPASPLYNIVDRNRLALIGHSFGGAVGLSAIDNSCLVLLCSKKDGFDRPQELVAGVFFGSNLRNQTSGDFIPIDNDRIPIALIQGDLDGVALPERAAKTYQSIQDPPKALITVKGANHYGITNQDSSRDPLRPSLEQATAIETIARWSALFLLASISQDPDAIDYVYRFGDRLDPHVTVIEEKNLR